MSILICICTPFFNHPQIESTTPYIDFIYWEPNETQFFTPCDCYFGDRNETDSNHHSDGFYIFDVLRAPNPT